MKRLSILLSQVHKTEERASMENVTIPIRLLGLRGSGKTSFLYRAYFKYGTDQPDTVFDVIATPHHNMEVVPYQSHLYEIWDYPEMSQCLNDTRETAAIVYFVDSVNVNKKGMLDKSKGELIWLLQHMQKCVENAVIVTVANKQDHEDAMDVHEIGNAWKEDKVLMELLMKHEWRVFPCESLSGKGMDKILDYVTCRIDNKRRTSVSSSLRRYSSHQSHEITPWDSVPNPYHFNDAEFQQWFYKGNHFLFFDEECLIRIIYLTLCQKKTWNQLLSQLQTVLDTQPVQNDQYKSITYSETQTLFWIQMVSFALLKSPVLEGEKTEFETFKMRCPLDQQSWRIYYSPKVFNSIQSRREFMAPDLKPLPNAFKSSSLALKGSRLNIDYQVL